MEESKNVLRPEVAQKYECTIEPKPVILRPPIGNHRIDLRTMTLAEADELYKKGFEFLKLKQIEQPEGTTAEETTTGRKKINKVLLMSFL